MRSVLRIVVFVPLGLLLLFFAMANRGQVRIALDPLPGGDVSGPGFDAPLFLVVLASVALGVVAGSVSSWFKHRRHRRAAKEARAAAKQARAEADQLREQALSSLPSHAHDQLTAAPTTHNAA
ncbi:MAG: DUF1049 domain-containing protein [Methylocystis sp.]|nr:DUF1049 domain-containing protein [Methylocystis sp.]